MVYVSSCTCCVNDSDREGERDISHDRIIERNSQLKLSEVELFIELFLCDLMCNVN